MITHTEVYGEDTTPPTSCHPSAPAGGDVMWPQTRRLLANIGQRHTQHTAQRWHAPHIHWSRTTVSGSMGVCDFCALAQGTLVRNECPLARKPLWGSASALGPIGCGVLP
jgi:hypothetical protein